jgi:hypothetical protein
VNHTNDTISDLQHKVKVRERDISLLQKRIIANKQELQERDDTIVTLRTRIKELESSLSLKDTEMEVKQREFQSRIDAVQLEKDTVELNLAQANTTIERLSVFKNTKDNDDQMSARIWVAEKRELLVPEPQGITEISIKEAETLQKQLHDIMNSHIDDLEAALMQIKKKREILGGFNMDDDQVETNHLLDEFEMAMNQLQQEQSLLTEHIISLKVALTRYKEATEYLEWKKYAQETQRKYSISLFISYDQGKDFKQWKDSPFCSRCSERVILCPHMHAPGCLDAYYRGNCVTVPVPSGATHFQFRRPQLVVQVPTKILLNDSFAINEDEHDDYVDMKIHRATRFFKMLWHNFFNHRGLVRPVLPRIFTIDKLTRFMNDLCESRWKYEQDSNENIASFLVCFKSTLINVCVFFIACLSSRKRNIMGYVNSYLIALAWSRTIVTYFYQIDIVSQKYPPGLHLKFFRRWSIIRMQIRYFSFG